MLTIWKQANYGQWGGTIQMEQGKPRYIRY